MITEFSNMESECDDIVSAGLPDGGGSVNSGSKKTYKRPSTANKRLYSAILRAKFAPVYHGLLSIIVNYGTEAARPYDLHARLKTWLQTNVSENVTTSYKYIGVALNTLKLVRKKEKASGRVVLYNINFARACEYWEILSTDESYLPLLTTLRKGYSTAEYCRKELNTRDHFSRDKEKDEKIKKLLDKAQWLIDVDDIQESLNKYSSH